jgi:hypothetical protein
MRRTGEDAPVSTDLDAWHFICDDTDGTWTWVRLSPDGEKIAASDFSFRSFNVCLADARRAGYLNNVMPHRRVRSSDGMAVNKERRLRGRM